MTSSTIAHLKTASGAEPITPFFPRLRSGHRLFQRPSLGKQFPSSNRSSLPRVAALALALGAGAFGAEESPLTQARQRLEEAAREFNAPALRTAIADLEKNFPADYPSGRSFHDRLDHIERRLPARLRELAVPAGGDTEPLIRQADALIGEMVALRREALLGNPLVSGRPIIYVHRPQYALAYHAIDTLFHTDEDNTHLFTGPGALKKLDVKTGVATTLVEVPEGIVRDPEVHFDGTRIVFSMRRNIREDYKIWEIRADGTGLRQLTSADGVSDIDPLYLPDGSIAFTSTRDPKYNQCSRDIGANLFRMNADGSNIHQISRNNLFDSHGALMPDGRIMYHRWEYVDRNFGDAHGIWTVNPDGTNQAIHWGNNTASPGGVYYPRPVAETSRVLAIFGMHHCRMWGALAILDPQLGIDGRPAVLRTWPPEAIDLVRAGGPFDCDNFAFVYPKYEAPFPLNDKYFLVSRMTMRPGQEKAHGWDARHGEEVAIYLVDVFGNEILVHADDPGCYDPMPLAPHPRPPVIPTRRDFGTNDGRFLVVDVYEGETMRDVPRGTVKSLRVVESPEKRTWSQGSWEGQGFTAPGMNWHSLENKRILGTVPVESDGSAYFTVPSDRFVYFQLLDADGMMVQSMRSGTSAHSGETMSCVGCHDNRLAAPPAGRHPPLASGREASRLEGWYGPPREFGFMKEVQPVLDRNCVGCHDYGKPAGEKLNLASDRGLAFNTAYVDLWSKGYVAAIGAGPAEVQPAYAWGSHASRMIRELRDPTVKEHRDLKLDREDMDRLVTWIDLNGVYYDTYATAYPDSLTGRSPLDAERMRRLAELTEIPEEQWRMHQHKPGPLVSFDRPEMSSVLERFSGPGDPAYQEVLSIIRAGAAQLAERPRADMPGFVPCEVDQRREAKARMRRDIELRNRSAIRRGEKVRD